MRKSLVVLAAVPALLLAGCGADDGSETEAAPSAAPSAEATVSGPGAGEPAAGGVTVDVEIADGQVQPQGGRVEVEVGQEITLQVVSDAAEEVHVHSDPERTLDVEAGGSATQTFTIDTPGQVAVEAHELGVTIVQLVVRP